MRLRRVAYLLFDDPRRQEEAPIPPPVQVVSRGFWRFLKKRVPVDAMQELIQQEDEELLILLG